MENILKTHTLEYLAGGWHVSEPETFFEMAYTYLLTQGFTDVCVILGGYTALTEALKPAKVFNTIANL